MEWASGRALILGGLEQGEMFAGVARRTLCGARDTTLAGFVRLRAETRAPINLGLLELLAEGG